MLVYNFHSSDEGGSNERDRSKTSQVSQIFPYDTSAPGLSKTKCNLKSNELDFKMSLHSFSMITICSYIQCGSQKDANMSEKI